MSSAVPMSETESRVRSHTCSAVWPTFSIFFPSFFVPSPAGARPLGGLSGRVSTTSSSPTPACDLADQVADRDRANQALARILLDVGRRRIVERRKLSLRLFDLRPHPRADLARRLFDLLCHLHSVILLFEARPPRWRQPSANPSSIAAPRNTAGR